MDPITGVPTENVEPVEAPEASDQITREDLFKHSSFFKGQDNQPDPAENDNTEPPAAEPAPEAAPEAPPTKEVSQEETPLGEAPSEEVPTEPVKFKLTDEEEATLEQVLEWKQGHMMQSDYTKKTQALAEERRQLEAERAKFDPEITENAVNLWKQLELDPIGYLDKLREYYESQGIYEPKDQATLQLEQERRALEAEKQQLQQEKQQRLQQDNYAKLEAQLTKLAETYGKDFDRTATIQFMLNNNIADAEKAYKAMNHDNLTTNLQKQIDELNKKLKTVKAEAVNDYVKTKTTKSAAPPPVGASNSGAPPVQTSMPKTFDDAKRAALARMSNLTG